MRINSLLLIVFILFQTFSPIRSSDGDRSPFYQKCVKNCNTANCTDDGLDFTPEAADQQDVWCQLLQWTCTDECRYHCMWKTVQGFEDRGYMVPKFHGKWPFKRIFGVQEPASAFASFLNLLAHVYMHAELSRRFTVKTVPLVLFWHGFAAVCINAWLWSTIFHTRDNFFTEFMDYACALSMVLSLYIAAIVRAFHRSKKMTAALLFLPLVYFVDHVRYLYSGKVDYEYNMLINLIFGVIGSLVWLSWSLYHYLTGGRYVWRMVAFTVLSGVALTLELFDFPPKFDVWDAHALWHLSTVPLPHLFYKFVIDDLYYLQSSGVSAKDNFKLA